MNAPPSSTLSDTVPVELVEGVLGAVDAAGLERGGCLLNPCWRSGVVDEATPDAEWVHGLVPEDADPEPPRSAGRHRTGDVSTYPGLEADVWAAAPTGEIIDGRMPELDCAGWGPMGPGSRAAEREAVFEAGLRWASEMLVFIAPFEWIDSDERRRISRSDLHCRLALRIDWVPTGWSATVWMARRGWSYPNPTVADASGTDDWTSALERWTDRWGEHVERSRRRTEGVDPDLDWQSAFRRSEPGTVRSDDERGRDTVRVCVDGSGGRLRVVADSPGAKARLLSVRRALGMTHREDNNKRVYMLDRLCSARDLAHGDRGLEGIVEALEGAGLVVEVDEQAERWVDRIQNRARREAVPFEQVVDVCEDEDDHEWVEKHTDDGVRTELADLYEQNLDEVDRRVDWNLWGYQCDDIARMMCKPNALYAASQGLGKTRVSLSYIEALGGRRNLVMMKRRLFDEFLRECGKLGIPESELHEVDSPESARPENLRRINYISYSKIWRPVDDRRRTVREPVSVFTYEDGSGNKKERVHEGHDLRPGDYPLSPGTWDLKDIDETYRESEGAPAKTIAHVLRQTRFCAFVVDEVHLLKGGKSSKRSLYTLLIRAKHKLGMSGTPIKNYPRDIYALLVHLFGERTTASRWSYDEPIETEDGDYTSAPAEFRRKYTRVESASDDFDDDLQGGWSGGEVPMLPDEAVDDWREMLAPKMLRRHREEPEVKKHLDAPEPDEEDVEFKVDEQHAEFYHWWLESFREWYEAQLAEERAGEGAVNQAQVLAQLNKLRFAATVPQADNVRVDGEIKWPGGLTTKQEGVVEDVVERVGDDQNVLLFTEHPDMLDVMADELRDRGVSTVAITGSAPIDDRQGLMDTFRDGTRRVLMMSRECGQMGYNLAQADMIWQLDWPWTPDKLDQSEKRMLRPDWLTDEREASGAVPEVRRAVQIGTIDEYMRQLVYEKAEGIGEAIDWKSAEWDESEHMSYREFTERMFRSEGYSF